MSFSGELPEATEVEVAIDRPVALVVLLVFVGLAVGLIVVVIAVFLTLYTPPARENCADSSSSCSHHTGPGG